MRWLGIINTMYFLKENWKLQKINSILMTLTIIVDVYFMIYLVMVLYAQYDQNGHLLTLRCQVIQPLKEQLTKNIIIIYGVIFLGSIYLLHWCELSNVFSILRDYTVPTAACEPMYDLAKFLLWHQSTATFPEFLPIIGSEDSATKWSVFLRWLLGGLSSPSLTTKKRKKGKLRIQELTKQAKE